MQITAEQLLREAHERQEADFKPPRQKITDGEELQEYRYGRPLHPTLFFFCGTCTRALTLAPFPAHDAVRSLARRR